MAKIIYVVDDNDAVRAFVTKVYELGNYETREFSDADSLLEAITKGEKPDLILMDTDMPGINGYEACDRIKKDKTSNGVKIIGMSGNDYKKEWDKAGADCYLSKPLNLVDILDKTKELLGE